MSDDRDELSFSEMRKKRGEHLPARHSFEPELAAYEFPRASNPQPSHTPSTSREPVVTRKPRLPFDPMRVVAALKLHRRWLFGSACAFAIVGLLTGWYLSVGKISVTLILRDVSTTFTAGAGEKYRPTPLAMQTLVELMTSPELARRVAAKAQPPISESMLKNSVTASLGQDKDMVTLVLTGKNRRELAALARLYADETVQLSRDLQLAEVSRMNQFYIERIVAADEEMSRINDELVAFQKESGTIDPEAEAQAYTKQLSELLTRADSARIEFEMADMQIAALRTELGRQNPIAQKIEAAKSRLADLLGRNTELHPSVQAAREQIAALERQLKTEGEGDVSAARYNEGSLAGTLYLRLVELQSRKATLEKELQALDTSKQTLHDKVTGISRQSLRYAVIRAKLDSQKSSLTLLAGRQREAQLYEANAAGYFRLFANPLASDVNMTARWMQSFTYGLIGMFVGILSAALVVGVREIADGRVKTTADVRRVTQLPVLATLGDLKSMTPSESEQWAFRTWTALSGHLNASPNRGLVCGFISSSEGEGRSTWIKALADAAARRGLRVLTVAAQQTAGATDAGNETKTGTSVSENIFPPQVLTSPMAVAERFGAPNAPAVAHIPLNGWVWNLERRKQWQSAMTQWQAMDDLVLLVELPPASESESILLAENLPQVIWLADSGKARTRETRQQLETLRHAKCRLAGAVLNHEPEPAFKL